MLIDEQLARWRDDLDEVIDAIVTLRKTRRLWDDLVEAINADPRPWGAAKDVLEGWYSDTALIQARRLVDGDGRSLSLRTVLHQVKDVAGHGHITLDVLRRIHGPDEHDLVGHALARIVHGVDLVALDRRDTILAFGVEVEASLPRPDALTPVAVARHVQLLDEQAGPIHQVATQHVAHRQRRPEVDGYVAHEQFDAALETIGVLARYWYMLFGGPSVNLDVRIPRQSWIPIIRRLAPDIER